MAQADLIIRNALIADGSGGPLGHGDVAVHDGDTTAGVAVAEGGADGPVDAVARGCVGPAGIGVCAAGRARAMITVNAAAASTPRRIPAAGLRARCAANSAAATLPDLPDWR